MPNAREVFLIDATVFFEASHKAFMGAPLLVVNGEDHTFLFGVIRELLRLRQTLGIENGIFVIGEDAYEVTTSTNIEKTAAFLKQLGIPVICDHNTRVIDLCVSLASLATCIVTSDRKLLLFAKDGRRVILFKDGKEPEVFFFETVVSRLGVIPDLMPAFLALTDGPQPTKLTKELDLDQLMILNLLWTERRVDTAHVAEVIQKPESEVRAKLQQLVEAGYIEARGERKGRSFHLSAIVYKCFGGEAAYLRQKGPEPKQQEAMILDYLAKNGHIARTQAAELCKLSPIQAKYVLRKMVQSGKLVQKGVQKGTYYEKSCKL